MDDVNNAFQPSAQKFFLSAKLTDSPVKYNIWAPIWRLIAFKLAASSLIMGANYPIQSPGWWVGGGWRVEMAAFRPEPNRTAYCKGHPTGAGSQVGSFCHSAE